MKTLRHYIAEAKRDKMPEWCRKSYDTIKDKIGHNEAEQFQTVCEFKTPEGLSRTNIDPKLIKTFAKVVKYHRDEMDEDCNHLISLLDSVELDENFGLYVPSDSSSPLSSVSNSDPLKRVKRDEN